MYPEIFLWLFVLNLGVAFGAGLYEHRVVLPMWFERSASGVRVNVSAMNEIDSGRRFWAFVTTLPLTLLTLISLVLSSRYEGSRYEWWWGASVIALIERLGTFSYFIPTAIKLGRADAMPLEESAAMAARWMRSNYLREALTISAWLLALRALSLAG